MLVSNGAALGFLLLLRLFLFVSVAWSVPLCVECRDLMRAEGHLICRDGFNSAAPVSDFQIAAGRDPKARQQEAQRHEEKKRAS